MLASPADGMLRVYSFVTRTFLLLVSLVMHSRLDISSAMLLTIARLMLWPPPLTIKRLIRSLLGVRF